MLIIEGPDGSGKTSLVNNLEKLLKWPVSERVVGKDTEALIPSLRNWVEDNVRKGFHRTIYDRHRLISEPIYGPLFRGELTDGFDDIKWFEWAWTQLLMCRPFVIFCLPPLEEVQKNVDNDSDNAIVREQTPLIYWQYWSLYARAGSPVYLHDYTKPEYPLEYIINRINHHAERMTK